MAGASEYGDMARQMKMKAQMKKEKSVFGMLKSFRIGRQRSG